MKSQTTAEIEASIAELKHRLKVARKADAQAAEAARRKAAEALGRPLMDELGITTLADAQRVRDIIVAGDLLCEIRRQLNPESGSAEGDHGTGY